MKVVAEEQPIETVIEKAYFHIENGGLTLSIVEVKPAGDDRTEYRFKHELSMHGQAVESSFPLGSSSIVGWMNMALQRVSMKVAGIHQEGRYIPFDAPQIKVQNGMPVEKAASLLRIVATFQQRESKEFPSQKALQQYMKDHPGADPKNHSVKKPGEGGKDEKPKGTLKERAESHGETVNEERVEEKAEHKFTPWGKLIKENLKEKTLDRLKAVASAGKSGWITLKSLPKVMSYLEKEAPKEVKKLFEDSDHRRQVLLGAHKVLTSVSSATAKSLVDTFKRETHEFKEAYEGVKAAYHGKPMNDAQKNAVMACCWDATVLLVGTCIGAGLAHGAVAGASAGVKKFVTGFAQKVAMNALHDEIDDINIKDDLQELGEGMHHLYEFVRSATEHTAASKPKADDRAMMTAFVMQLVDRQMQKLSPDDFAEVIANVAQDKTIEKPKSWTKTAGVWTITPKGVVETV